MTHIHSRFFIIISDHQLLNYFVQTDRQTHRHTHTPTDATKTMPAWPACRWWNCDRFADYYVTSFSRVVVVADTVVVFVVVCHYLLVNVALW